MDDAGRSGVFPLSGARDLIPGPAGQHFVTAFEHGSLRLLLSLPADPNVQRPHEQDELYIVVQGSGVLFHGGRHDPFQVGDAMFVPAGMEHRFEDFTDDLAVWVVFYGPSGGEGRGPPPAAL